MNTDEIINKAIQELKENDKPYKMLKEFSFMSGLEGSDGEFQKIRYLLMHSSPFVKHTDQSLKLSSIGLTIANDFKDWYAYKKSLKAKFDYAKWAAIVIAFLSLMWNIYQEISNNTLKDENKVATERIKKLEEDNDKLASEIRQLKNQKIDSVGTNK
jgi:large-conductance mechanosensitive channel